MAALLHGLPLQPEESDRCELMDAKSELFLKYFTLFMNLMNNCKESSEEKDVVSRQTNSKLATLRDTTIQAMSNLLSANIDSGLRHSISTKEYQIFSYVSDFILFKMPILRHSQCVINVIAFIRKIYLLRIIKGTNSIGHEWTLQNSLNKIEYCFLSLTMRKTAFAKEKVNYNVYEIYVENNL